MRAATEVVQHLGLSFTDAVVLRDQSNLLVHFRPTPVVARIATGTASVRRGNAWLARELAVASQLAGAGAPVVPPSTELPPGPYSRDGFAMTLWEFVDPLGEPAAPGLAGRTLRVCHEALDDFEGELPLLGLLNETGQILSLLAKQGRLPPGDSQLLDRMLARSFQRIEELGLLMKPVHGDANLGNLLNTARGPLWTDWEDTFRGPREWDLACLVTRSRVLGEGGEAAQEALAGYGSAVGEDVLAPLVEARAVQVAAWLALGSLSISTQASRLEERLAWLRARDRAA